ncbi:hypothetical protein GCM10027359_27440 [Marilutibacter aestuarii]
MVRFPVRPGRGGLKVAKVKIKINGNGNGNCNGNCNGDMPRRRGKRSAPGDPV